MSGPEKVITDGQSALELAMSVKYETRGQRIVLDKRSVSKDFFFVATREAAIQKLAEA